MVRNYTGVVVLVLALTMMMVMPVTAGEATQIAKNAGDVQTAIAGSVVTIPPSVIVKDANGDPVSGASVTFAIASGSGTVTGGTATTDTSGVATVGSWTLGSTAGTNTLTATSGSLTGSPLTFTATGTAGPATQLVKYAGDSQSATVGTAVSTLPSVIVKDVNNNPVNAASVTFSVTSGSGSATGLTTTTGSNGIATVGSWTLGSTAGTNILTVTSGSLTPVTFIATGTSATSAPTISSITPVYGDNSSAVSITALTGTGFVSGATILLSGTGQTNISASNVVFVSSTKMTCTFDIAGKPAGTRNIILTNPDGLSATLSSGFEIRNPSNGSISFGSSPSGASVYINATKKGTTPFSLYDLVPGSYFIRMQRSDYADYTTQAIVTSGNATQVYAYLSPSVTYTTTPTTVPPTYTTVTTVKTTKKTTTKVPTPWPSATTTQASPIGPLVIIGALGLGFVILRRD